MWGWCADCRVRSQEEKDQGNKNTKEKKDKAFLGGEAGIIPGKLRFGYPSDLGTLYCPAEIFSPCEPSTNPVKEGENSQKHQGNSQEEKQDQGNKNTNCGGAPKGAAKASCGETVVQKRVFGESVSSLPPFGRPFLRTTPSPLL